MAARARGSGELESVAILGIFPSLRGCALDRGWLKNPPLLFGERFAAPGRIGQCLNRFVLTPPPRTGSNAGPFAAQLALSRAHPCLVALERTPGGYAVPRDATRGWFELNAKRGLAGYGLARALRMLLDVLAGLSALEETRTQAGQPFVHGELVPAMVRIDPAGTARLIPLARWHWAEPGTVPAPERCGHLAPERLLGDALDARADVFSAGVLLWEALAGRRLFESDSVDVIVTRLMGEKVTLPQLPPELSWAVPLKAVAMCALSVDPEQRFANASELAEAITAVVGNHVATHADVAQYFGAPPEVAARPSLIVRPPQLPAHHSSLSALVAPVQPSAPPESGSTESVGREASLPERRGSGRIWAIAATCCLISAFLGSTVARHLGAQGAAHSASQSAPPPAAALPAAVPPAAVLPAAVPPAAVPLPSAQPEPTASAAPEPVAPVAPVPAASTELPGEHRDKASKAPKTPAAPKKLAPKLQLPGKAVRSPDKAAAKYGI